MGKKKGQITSFIIIGILLLFSVGLLIYVSQLRGGITIFAQQESPLQQYIGTCLELTAKDAINLIGATGGYMEVPENIAINERAYFAFAPKTQPKIPLWYYRQEPRVPTMTSIESNISQYIVDNINSCLGDFTEFKSQFELSSRGNISAETIVSETGVTIELNYPLETRELQSGVISRTDFVTRAIEVRLGRMYAMAVDILRSENQQLFFENLTVELLSTHPDIPFTGTEFSCAPRQWRKSQVINTAKNIISANFPQVTVEGNPRTLFDSNNLYARNHFIFSLSQRYSGISTVFQYPTSARFEMHVNPRDTEYMKSNVGQSIGFCINSYHFSYDIEYPLLVSLRDANAFDNEGFIFNFAFPVTIDSNKGVKQDIPYSVIDSPDLLYDFCQTTDGSSVDVRVSDSFTYEQIYGANVKYNCVRYSCDLGQTKSDGGAYRVLAQLPSSCETGLLVAEKEGYLSGNAVYRDTSYVEIPMTPLKTLRVNVQKFDDTDFLNPREIDNGEDVIVTIRGISHPTLDQAYSTENSDLNEIQLVYGEAEYRIEALIVRHGATQDTLTGGYVGTFSVSYSDIADATELTINVVQKTPIAVTEDEQIAAADYLFNNADYQAALKPIFN